MLFDQTKQLYLAWKKQQNYLIYALLFLICLMHGNIASLFARRSPEFFQSPEGRFFLFFFFSANPYNSIQKAKARTKNAVTCSKLHKISSTLVRSFSTPHCIAVHYPNGQVGQVIAIQPSGEVYAFKNEWKSNRIVLAQKGEVWVREGTRKRRLDPKEALEFAAKKARF
ncbi:MAG: hypothetical protein ACE5OZ_23100, partial [Candidatus Heimdallarchaeota archaeon]